MLCKSILCYLNQMPEKDPELPALSLATCSQEWGNTDPSSPVAADRWLATWKKTAKNVPSQTIEDWLAGHVWGHFHYNWQIAPVGSSHSRMALRRHTFQCNTDNMWDIC